MSAGFTSPDPIRVDLGKWLDLGWRDLAVRFAFGAVIAVAAGVASQVLGAGGGGLFLAFPAILPASLTLIEDKEGRRKAGEGARGSILAVGGMAAFALVAIAGFGRIESLATVALALLAWAAVSIGLYLLARAANR